MNRRISYTVLIGIAGLLFTGSVFPYGISQEDRERAVELLEDVGLGDRISFNPNELSGGQKQRVAICRALINNPEIIFADEPTGNLDTKRGNEILALLKEINKKYGTAIVVVTHDPNVEKFSNRTIEIEDGRIVSDKNKS